MSEHPSVSRTLSLMLAGLLVCASVAAQQKPPVLRGAQVTEDALIDALAIDGPAAAEGGATRGFAPALRPRPVNPGKAPGAGKSNLMITFLTNSATLTPEGVQVLDTVARALQSDTLAGFTFRIEGHADPRGQDEHNRALSEQRAQAVVDYLVTERGILPERLQAIGKGSSELYDTQRLNAPENRRVTIVTTR